MLLEQVAKLQSRHDQMLEHIKDRIEDLEREQNRLGEEINNEFTREYAQNMARGQRISIQMEIDHHKRLLNRIQEKELVT